MLKLEITVNFDLKLLIWQDFLGLLSILIQLRPRNIAKIHHLQRRQQDLPAFSPVLELIHDNRPDSLDFALS
jgi:hypothetical protein